MIALIKQTVSTLDLLRLLGCIVAFVLTVGSCTSREVRVVLPNSNPTLSLFLDKNEVSTGQIITAVARTNDPDGDPISYSWWLDGQVLRGRTSVVRVNTARMPPGRHVITATARDDRGGETSDSVLFSIELITRAEAPIPNNLPLFPWPPPRASATELVPTEFFSQSQDEYRILTDIDRKLIHALDSFGYFDISYYAVPDGFAMVSKMEQIKDDGTSKDPPDRWVTQPRGFRLLSPQDWVLSLLGAPVGRYRVIVFVVTPHPFTQREVDVTAEEVQDWLGAGLNTLPDQVGEIEYQTTYRCTALIYEFVRPSTGEVRLVENGPLTARAHLDKSRLWEALEHGR